MTNQPTPQVGPKTKFTLVLLALAAVLSAATAFYPPLKPLCQAFGGCVDEPVATAPAEPAVVQ